MIKNTSGLAVQPCRLHERFYYHARLLYYILRQKARGFFDAGAEAPAPPFFLSASPEGFCGGGGPSTSGSKSSDLAPRSALHPGEFFAGRQSQPPTMRGVPPLHSPERALRPAPRPTFSRRESRQRYARNLLVPGPPAQGGGPPWIPPASALAVLVESKKVCGILGGRRGRWGCRYPFLYSGKKLLDARWGVRAVHSR